jgi:Cu-Zn family superoxide dismutase
MRQIPSRSARALKALGLTATLVLAGCAGMGMSGPSATSKLEARRGSSVAGTVQFAQHGDHVMVRAEISGLKPGQEHGFHIHDKGDCTAPDGMSAAGHFNPTAKPHGPQESAHHGGDMPALRADADGKVVVRFHLEGVTVADGPTSIVGRSLIVHRDPDDYKTQPTGNSGARIACGLITKA